MSANWVGQISMRSRESKAVVVGVVPKYGSSKCVPCIFRFLIIFIMIIMSMIIIENEKSTDQISIRHALKGTLGSLGSLWDFSSKSETDLFFLKISLFPKKKKFENEKSVDKLSISYALREHFFKGVSNSGVFGNTDQWNGSCRASQRSCILLKKKMKLQIWISCSKSR